MIDPYAAYDALTRNLKEFEVTEDHLKLLRRANVTFGGSEWGAPCIDGKRPYGSGNLVESIAQALWPQWDDWDQERQERYLGEARDNLIRLHAATTVALEICLLRGEFKPGWYRLVDWRQWEPVQVGGPRG